MALDTVRATTYKWKCTLCEREIMDVSEKVAKYYGRQHMKLVHNKIVKEDSD